MSRQLSKQAKINQELAILIDEDLQQEQTLLKALIEEILKANEKIKNAHFERVEDTESKLKVLNAEIRRIRKNIRAQDDVVQDKRLALLKETKKEYFSVFSDLRLKDAKDHFSQPLKMHLKSLGDALSAHVKTYLPNRIKEFEGPLKAFYDSLSDVIHDDANQSLAILSSQESVYPTIIDDIDAVVQPLKSLILAFKKNLEATLESHLQMFDTSELDELLKDIEETTQQDLSLINDQVMAIDEALTDDLKQLDDAFNQEKKARLDAYFKTLPSDTDRSQSDQLSKTLKDLEKQRAKAKEPELQASLAKQIKDTQALYFKTPVGKMAKKVEKELKSVRKKLGADKTAKRNEHLEQSYELKMQHTERTIQSVIDSASLKLRTGITALELNEDTYNQSIDLFEQYLLDIFNFERAIQQLLASLKSKTLELNKKVALLSLIKDAQLSQYKKIIQRLEIQILNQLTERQADFKKLQVEMDAQLEKERLEIEMLYGLTKITDQRLRLISRAKVNKLDEVQALKFQLFQDEADIKLAEKEYDIQVLKAQSIYDHERAINKVQTERIDAGVHVNKAMVQATVKRQVNFADQQIRFAEAELAARLEHIEYTLQQELSYTEETLGYLEKAYENERAELELDYQSKKQSIEPKKKLFQHSPMLNKVLQEEIDLELTMAEKRQAFEERVANDINIHRYREQIAKAKEHAENTKNDAINLHQKDIESFEALKAESLERLANVEKMMASPTLLPYHEESLDDQASKRLKEMLDSAEMFLTEKLKGPRVRIEETQERLLALEKETSTSTELSELLNQESELNEAYQDALSSVSQKASSDISNIDKSLSEDLHQASSVLDTITASLDKEITFSDGDLKVLENAQEKHLKDVQRVLETALRDIDAKEDEWIIDLRRTQEDAARERLDLVLKMQMKVEKVEGYLKPAINVSFKTFNKAFKKEKF